MAETHFGRECAFHFSVVPRNRGIPQQLPLYTSERRCISFDSRTLKRQVTKQSTQENGKKENFNMDFDYCAREDIHLQGNGDIMICEAILKDVNLNGISQPQESQLLYYDEGIPLEEDGLTLEQMIEAIEKPVIFAEDEMTSTTIVTTSNTMNTGKF